MSPRGPARARTRLAPEARREQLLEIARALFERDGYDGVTFERIGERAGVSPALVHHYFGTKREVFLAVVAAAISGFQAAVAPAPAAVAAELAAPPRERLRAAVGRYLDFVLERPKGYAFVIGAQGAPDGEVREAIGAAREAVHAALLVLVGISAPTGEQDLAMWGWLGFVERSTTRWIERGARDRPGFVALLLRAADPLLGD